MIISKVIIAEIVTALVAAGIAKREIEALKGLKRK